MLKDFDQSGNNSQEKLQFYLFYTKDFCVIQTEACFMEFSYVLLFQPIRNKYRQRKVSTFLHYFKLLAVVAFVLIWTVS